MNDLLGQPIREKRAIKPPKIHLATPYAETVCVRWNLPKTNDLERVTCDQCLSRVNAARKRAASITDSQVRELSFLLWMKERKP